MATIELDMLKQQSGTLLPKQKLALIKYLSESLSAEKNKDVPKFLEFGKYRDTGQKASTIEDFKIAEWHPTEADLNGGIAADFNLDFTVKQSFTAHRRAKPDRV